MKLIEQHYRDNYDNLVKKLSRPAGSEMDAEDVIQSTYERCLRYLPTFVGDTMVDFEKWFSIILRNCMATLKNDQKAAGLVIEYKDKKEEGIEMPVGDYKIAGKIRAIVERERPLVQEIFRLHITHGLKLPQVSELVTVTYGTVRKEVMKLKQKIKEELNG